MFRSQASLSQSPPGKPRQLLAQAAEVGMCQRRLVPVAVASIRPLPERRAGTSQQVLRRRRRFHASGAGGGGRPGLHASVGHAAGLDSISGPPTGGANTAVRTPPRSAELDTPGFDRLNHRRLRNVQQSRSSPFSVGAADHETDYVNRLRNCRTPREVVAAGRVHRGRRRQLACGGREPAGLRTEREVPGGRRDGTGPLRLPAGTVLASAVPLETYGWLQPDNAAWVLRD